MEVHCYNDTTLTRQKYRKHNGSWLHYTWPQRLFAFAEWVQHLPTVMGVRRDKHVKKCIIRWERDVYALFHHQRTTDENSLGWDGLMVLHAGTMMSNDVPWRNTKAEKEHKAECLAAPRLYSSAFCYLQPQVVLQNYESITEKKEYKSQDVSVLFEK